MANSFIENLAFFFEDIYYDIKRKTPFKNRQYFLKDIDSKYDFVEIDRKTLSTSEIAAQYNPERFKAYQSVVKCDNGNVLDMNISPHCKLLKDYHKGIDVWLNFNKSSYYRLQKRFGKSRKSAKEKAKKLIALFDDIKTNGFKGEITVIDKPIIPNPYNQSYEIYEGHHRTACCIVLGINKIDAIILKAEPKEIILNAR
ncbi:MAG: hypothetical protein A2Y12_04195 [Planctomycetes bacterium GWF2_42_9]|nr:MAG: hypothetical protein A2Y12_04195 [Planctomycetes bacterium GWF2_42_9]HAL45840.1 hypothetical protein [Phycisphaerales bacterium]